MCATGGNTAQMSTTSITGLALISGHWISTVSSTELTGAQVLCQTASYTPYFVRLEVRTDVRSRGTRIATKENTIFESINSILQDLNQLKTVAIIDGSCRPGFDANRRKMSGGILSNVRNFLPDVPPGFFHHLTTGADSNPAPPLNQPQTAHARYIHRVFAPFPVRSRTLHRPIAFPPHIEQFHGRHAQAQGNHPGCVAPPLRRPRQGS